VAGRLNDDDIQRIAQATERAVFRATLRAIGLIALVGAAVWVGFTLLVIAFSLVMPSPGRPVDLGAWVFVLAILAALVAGGYVVVRSIRGALR
jgi:hypothetical protein